MGRVFIVFIIAWSLLGYSGIKGMSQRQNQIKPLADTLVLLQADGSKVHIVCSGNFVLSYCETTDGYTVIVDAIGMYEYAKKGHKGDLIAAGVQAKDADKRSAEEMRSLRKIPKHLRYSGQTLQLLEEKQKRMDEGPAIIKRDKKN